MTARILVTGSRTWNHDTDHRIEHALRQAWQEIAGCGSGVVLVHGAAPGVDRIAAAIWARWGQPTEAHPADWSAPCRPTCTPGHRRCNAAGRWYCPAAGVDRNAAMVTAGADLCVAFIRDQSRGATHCAKLATAAGIPTLRIRWDSPIQDEVCRYLAGSRASWRI